LKSSLNPISVPTLSTALLSIGCSEAFNARLPPSVCTPVILSKGMVAILEKTLK